MKSFEIYFGYFRLLICIKFLKNFSHQIFDYVLNKFHTNPPLKLRAEICENLENNQDSNRVTQKRMRLSRYCILMVVFEMIKHRYNTVLANQEP